MTEKFQRLPAALKRGENLAWRCAAAAMALLYLVSVPREWQCEGVDEIEYLSLAHSMAGGLGYTIYGAPHVLYPPFYAGVLSVPWRLADGPVWPLLYGLNAAAGAAGLILFGVWLRRRHGAAGPWASWLLVTAYYPWSFSTRYLLAEPLFLLLSALLLMAVERARATRVSPLLVVTAGGLSALLALTRFASVTLLAGIAFALLFDAWRRKLRAPALLGLVIGGVGLAVLAGWELRAQRLDPHARESYGKWVQALTGSGGTEARNLAERAGEGVAEKTPWVKRVALAGAKTGQYVLSVPRVTPHFLPLGWALCGLCLWGWLAQLRRDPASPVAWYVGLTMLVITLTSWVSSYHRYLYPLSPFLFLYTVMGIRSAWANRANLQLRALAGAGATAGLLWWMRHGLPVSGHGAEGLYAVALGWLTAGLFATLLYFAYHPPSVVRAGLALALVAALAFQNGGLVLLRFRQTLRDATPVARDLLGFRDACAWLRSQAAAGDPLRSNLPAVASFLTGHIAAPAGELPLAPGTWVVVSGPLRDFPAYEAGEESRLRAALPAAAQPRFSSGAAAVYKVPAP